MCHNWETKRRENDYRWFSCPLKSHSDRDWKSLLADRCSALIDETLFYFFVEFNFLALYQYEFSLSRVNILFFIRSSRRYKKLNSRCSEARREKWSLFSHITALALLSLEIVWIQYEIALVVFFRHYRQVQFSDEKNHSLIETSADRASATRRNGKSVENIEYRMAHTRPAKREESTNPTSLHSQLEWMRRRKTSSISHFPMIYFLSPVFSSIVFRFFHNILQFPFNWSSFPYPQALGEKSENFFFRAGREKSAFRRERINRNWTERWTMMKCRQCIWRDSSKIIFHSIVFSSHLMMSSLVFRKSRLKCCFQTRRFPPLITFLPWIKRFSA